jgi:hypothetical protein
MIRRISMDALKVVDPATPGELPGANDRLLVAPRAPTEGGDDAGGWFR